MLPVRIAFDPALPLIVSVTEAWFGDVRLVSGDTVPWQQLGISVQTLFEIWRAGLIAHPVESGIYDTPAPSQVVTMTVSPSETISIETPAQRNARTSKSKR